MGPLENEVLEGKGACESDKFVAGSPMYLLCSG